MQLLQQSPIIPWDMLSFRNSLPPFFFLSLQKKYCTFYNQALTDLGTNCLGAIIPANSCFQPRIYEPRAPSCVLPWNLKERFHRMHVKEGRVSVPQFNGCNPQGPDVTTRVIGRVILLLTSDNLSDKGRTQYINPTATSDVLKGPWLILAPSQFPWLCWYWIAVIIGCVFSRPYLCVTDLMCLTSDMSINFFKCVSSVQ